MKRYFFHTSGIYWQEASGKEAAVMWESNDPNTDLEDLIFEKEDGGPSQR